MDKEKPIKWRTIEPDVWKPENEEDFVQGVYINKKENIGMSEDSKAYYLDTSDGIKMVWGSTVLDDRMRLVPEGSYIRITYKETTQNKKGQPVKIYKVEVGDLSPIEAEEVEKE